MKRLKKILGALVVMPPIATACSRLLRDSGVIFMLHRFRDSQLGIEGYDPAQLRKMLAYLRRERFHFLSLEEFFDQLASGNLQKRALAFTIDDGYRDEVVIGGEVFAEFDCPVTTFATSGFIDRQLWFWWDRIDYVFRNTKKRSVAVAANDRNATWQWDGDGERHECQMRFTADCKQMPDAAKHEAIERLAIAAEIGLPEQAPPQYAPASWDELRAAERKDMTFGPHTVTHPILSQTSDLQSEHEIRTSWMRLQAELQRPVPIFCYPNGQPGDFGRREIQTMQRIGLRGAVVGLPRYAEPSAFRRSTEGPYMVPRFGMPEAQSELIQYVKGVEKLKQILRGERANGRLAP